MVMKDRRLILIIIVSIVVVGLGLVFLWRRTTIQPEVLPPLPAVEIESFVPQPALSNYTLRAALPQIEKLPVYRYSETRNQPGGWSRALGFSGEPEILEDALEGTLYLWSKEGQTLVVDEQSRGLSYRVDLNEPAVLSGSFLPTFEQAASIVERTLEELGSPSELLEYNDFKSEPLKTGVSLVQETTLTEAEFLEIHFTAKIGDYPVCLEGGPEWDPVLAWVGRDGKLLRLEYHPIGTVGEKIADYPLKNSEEVLRDLDSGKGVVVSSNLEGGEEIISTTITKVSLGYLLPQATTTAVQPFFVLTGQARTASGKSGAVTIYLPAAR